MISTKLRTNNQSFKKIENYTKEELYYKVLEYKRRSDTVKSTNCKLMRRNKELRKLVSETRKGEK